jgi:hypothetical protein
MTITLLREKEPASMETLKASKATATLTAVGNARIRKTAVAMIFIVGISAALLSWNGLTFLAITAGFPAYLAWLLPVSIDGMLVLGSASILHTTMTNQKVWFGWVMTAVGVGLSIWGNVASVGVHDLQSQLVHGIPPLLLFLSIESGVKIVSHRLSVNQELEALAEKEASKEAKRLERLQEQEKVSVALKTKDAKVLLSQTKRGGKKVSATDPEVDTYKALLESLGANVSKVGMVTAILSAHPEARTTHMALAMDVDSRSLGTTVMRAKAKLLNGEPVSTVTKPVPVVSTDNSDATEADESNESTEQKDKFQEIVKQF